VSRKGRKLGKTRSTGIAKPVFTGTAFPSVTWADLWSVGSRVALTPDQQIYFRMQDVVFESIARVRAAREAA